MSAWAEGETREGFAGEVNFLEVECAGCHRHLGKFMDLPEVLAGIPERLNASRVLLLRDAAQMLELHQCSISPAEDQR